MNIREIIISEIRKPIGMDTIIAYFAFCIVALILYLLIPPGLVALDKTAMDAVPGFLVRLYAQASYMLLVLIVWTIVNMIQWVYLLYRSMKQRKPT